MLQVAEKSKRTGKIVVLHAVTGFFFLVVAVAVVIVVVVVVVAASWV